MLKRGTEDSDSMKKRLSIRVDFIRVRTETVALGGLHHDSIVFGEIVAGPVGLLHDLHSRSFTLLHCSAHRALAVIGH